MKYAADFREIARDRLRGRWAIAIGVTLLAMLLCGDFSNVLRLNVDLSRLRVELQVAGNPVFATDALPQLLGATKIGTYYILLLVVLVVGILFMVLSSVVRVGYSRFCLDMVDDRTEPKVGTLFRYFPNWKTTLCAALLQGLYVFLWSLLFIIPGIIASYSYAMTYYVLADDPGLSAREAISYSKDMMWGNRSRLFCLWFSFIGWELLGVLSFGIGMLWVAPYENMATAAFYREISGTWVSESTED